MVTHGQGDGAYTHYSIDLWPGDLNFTITSLARLLQRFEQQPIQFSRDLFPHPPSNLFFEILMKGNSQCMNILPKILFTNSIRWVSLPKHLYLQLENSTKDNKNQFFMAFLSMLTHCGVYKKTQVEFLWSNA